MLMTPHDVMRWQKACRMIEDDHEQAYFTCREKYGPDIAGALLVMILRQKFNKNLNQWPPPEDLVGEVNDFLREKGLLK